MLIIYGGYSDFSKIKTAVGAEALVHYYIIPYLFTVWGAYFLLGVISTPIGYITLPNGYNNLLY